MMMPYGTSGACGQYADVGKQETKEMIRRRCGWLLILVVVFIAVALCGGALGMYLYGRPGHKHSNIKSFDDTTGVMTDPEEDIIDEFESIHLEGAIVNELNHPKAYRAMRIVRDILRKNKGGPVMDREFRRSYNIEQACCLPNACEICSNIKWYCCDHQPEDDIYLPRMIELEEEHQSVIEEGDQKHEEIQKQKQRKY